jgi:hypothetical protein
MSNLKFSAFGGYSDLELFYGQISEQTISVFSSSMHENFVFVGLMKYFFMNVNIPLFAPSLVLVVYAICLVRKYRKRASCLRYKQLKEKDEYTKLRRSVQWVYDHLVFPFINIFSMVSFFSSIIQLSADLSG